MGLSASAPKAAVVNQAHSAFFHVLSNSLFPISISPYIMQPDLVKASIKLTKNNCYPQIQSGARKTGPPSRRSTWAQVSDCVQEIKQMQLQSTYWLEKVLKMISLYVSALVHAAAYCHTRDATQRCQFGPLSCIACMTICCSVHKSALTYKEIIFSTFSNR